MRQFTQSHLLTTSPDYLPGVNARTQVVVDRIVVEDYDPATDDVITIATGEGAVMAAPRLSAGQSTPIELELNLTSGTGVRAFVGSGTTLARIYYYNSSTKVAIPNAGY